MLRVLIAVALLGAFVMVRQTQAVCTMESPCKCRDEETGKYIDITGLANKEGTYAFETTEAAGQQTRTFQYNPCLSFSTNSSSCENVALCELDSITGNQYGIGSQTGAMFVYLPSDPTQLALKYTYSSSTSSGSSFVALVCDPDVRVPVLTFISEGPPGTLFFNFTTACACPGGCREEPIVCDELLGGRNCSCALRNSTGQFQGLVDLMALNDPFNPMSVNAGGNIRIYFNPCSDMQHVRFNPTQCDTMTVCLAQGNQAIDYGRGHTGKFSGNLQSDAVLTYTSENGNKSAAITLICDPDQRHSPALSLASPVTADFISLELRSVCACPGGCEQEQVTCKPQSDDCSCTLSQDLGTFTLKDLDNPDGPLHAVGPDRTNYYYNPCSNITVKGPNGFCKNVSGCKINEPSGTDYALGLQSLVSYRVSNFDPNIVTLMYAGGSEGKSFYIEAHCSHEADHLVFEFLKAVPSPQAETAVYYFYLESDHVCARP